MRSPSLGFGLRQRLSQEHRPPQRARCAGGRGAPGLFLPCFLPPCHGDRVKLFPTAPRSAAGHGARPGLARPGVFCTHLSVTPECVSHLSVTSRAVCPSAECFVSISVSFTGRLFFGKSSGRGSVPVLSLCWGWTSPGEWDRVQLGPALPNFGSSLGQQKQICSEQRKSEWESWSGLNSAPGAANGLLGQEIFYVILQHEMSKTYLVQIFP